MGQEEPRKAVAKLDESPLKTEELVGKHEGETRFSNKLRPVDMSAKDNKFPERKERVGLVKLSSVNSKSERVHCGELSACETMAKIAPEKPALVNKGPSKTFKRPKSYIHGRINRTSNHYCPREKPGPGITQSDKSSGVKEPMKLSLPEGTASQEERELAALNRINFLNKRLKAQESTHEYFKSFPDDDCSDMVLDPDPPEWSYESYSGSERQEASLSGLKSYIRANESHLGGCEEDVQDVSSSPGSPQESLVSYLDGVLSSRYTLRKCSLSLDSYSDGEEAGNMSLFDGYNIHSSGSRLEKPHKRSKADQHRFGSSERVRRLEDSIVDHFEEVEVNVAVRKEASGEVEEQKNFFSKQDRKEPNVLERRQQLDASVNKSRRSSSERSSPSSRRQGNSPGGSCYNINTERHEYPGMAKNARSVCKTMCPMAWGIEESEAEGSSNTADTTIPSAVLTKPYILSKGARSADEDKFSHGFKSDPHHVQGVGKLLIYSGRAIVPTLQAQETSLAVDDGYLLSDEDDADIVELPHDCLEGEKASKNRRLIVQQPSRSSARIWSSSKTSQKSDKFSLSRRSPGDEDEVENVDGYDEADENEENDDEFQDLIIQTELSQGSKVKVSDNNGPIADIENGPGDGSETSKCQVVGFDPETDEMNILNNQLSKKNNDKSQNNGKYGTTDTSSSSTVHEKRATENIVDKDGKTKRQSPNTKGSPKTDMKRDKNSSKKKSTWKLSSQGFKSRQKIINDISRVKRTSPASSPPKPSPALSPGRRKHEQADLRHARQVEVPGKKDMIKIPTDHDGKTRVLLVLRTPPKKTKNENDGREKSGRRSPERKITSANLHGRSPKRSPGFTESEKPSSPSSALAKLPWYKRSEENESQRSSSKVGERLQSPEFLNDSSPEFSDQAALPHARSGRRRTSRKSKLDTLVPQSCGQDGYKRFTAADEEEERTTEENVRDKDVREDSNDTRNDFVDGTPEPAEAATKARSPCRFSLYHPCQHGETEPLLNTDVQAKPQVERGKGTRLSPDKKSVNVDHGPCSFNNVQPCSHVTHSPCQFDPFKPCQHEECDIPEAIPPVTDVAKTQFSSKHEKTSKRSGFVYNSKKLQEKFGQHSPCMFDRYKPCLHEEVLGPLDNVKNKAGISLLPKTLNKNDPKKKETVNLVQCKFNRYTPCFHEDEIKVNKALGRKASLLAEKSKLRQPAPTSLESEEAEDPCSFSPFRPCFCHEKAKASNAKTAKPLENVEETPQAKRSSLGVQESPIKSKTSLSNTVSSKLNIETPNKISSTWSWFTNKASISSQGERREEKAEKSTGNQLTLAPADGPGLVVKTLPPRARSGLGVGEGGIPKQDVDMNQAGADAENSAASSFLGRISRAWFSSTRAQVARLAPQPHVIVTPTLRPDLGLSCSDKVSLEQPQVAVSKAVVTGLGAGAGSYRVLKSPKQESPQNRTRLTTKGQRSLVSDQQSMNYNAQIESPQGNENPFKRQLLHEMSLADSLRTCESCETDSSKETDTQELTETSSSDCQMGDLNVGGVDHLSLAETCSGQSASLAQRPVCPQLWTRGHGVPEDFLVLTSNIYPMSNFTEETAGIRKLVDADPEVLSADPLPVHFSDVVKTNRGDEDCGGEFFNESSKKLYSGQAGLILCHSSKRSSGRSLGGPVDPNHPGSRHSISQQEPSGATFTQDQPLRRADIEEAVETLLEELNVFDKGQCGSGNTRMECSLSGDEVQDGTAAATFTTRGDVCADPLSEHHIPRKSRNRKKSLAVVQNVHKRSPSGEKVDLPRGSAYEEYASNQERYWRNKEVFRGQDLSLEKTDDFHVRELSGQNGLSRDSQTDLSSKDREDVVVAAAELMSYRSFLDSLNKFAKADPGLSVPTSKSSSGYGTDMSRGRNSKFLTANHYSSTTGSPSPGNSDCSGGEQTDDDDDDDDDEDESDVTSSESITGRGDVWGDTRARSKSRYDNSCSIPTRDGSDELLGGSETTDTAEDMKKSFVRRQENILEEKFDNCPDGKRDLELFHESPRYNTVYRDDDDDGVESFPQDPMMGHRPDCHTLITEIHGPHIVHNVCNPLSVGYENTSLKQVCEQAEEEDWFKFSLDRDAAQESGMEDTRNGYSVFWEVQARGEDSSTLDDSNSSGTDDSEDTDEDEEEDEDETEDDEGE